MKSPQLLRGQESILGLEWQLWSWTSGKPQMRRLHLSRNVTTRKPDPGQPSHIKVSLSAGRCGASFVPHRVPQEAVWLP